MLILLNVSLYDIFPWLAPEEKEEDTETTTIPLPKLDKCETEEQDDPEHEVFNIANNKYTYEDAQAICKSYDATLATYDQIERAYNNGAEWCNYGWSADQMILFPTQKKTWEKLQKIDEDRGCDSNAASHKNDCGRPGINGGYIANPYVKFGVNCFGKKPKASDEDLLRMNAKQNQAKQNQVNPSQSSPSQARLQTKSPQTKPPNTKNVRLSVRKNNLIGVAPGSFIYGTKCYNKNKCFVL